MLSGVSWNPAGLTLTSNIYSLQAASLAGVFGLSFWVILVNLLALRIYIAKEGNAKRWPLAGWLCALALPYLYGMAHMAYHESNMADQPRTSFKAVLVQTAFPAEESDEHRGKKNLVDSVIDEWRQILQIAKKYAGQSFDLMVSSRICRAIWHLCLCLSPSERAPCLSGNTSFQEI